jgi:cyanophycinase
MLTPYRIVAAAFLVACLPAVAIAQPPSGPPKGHLLIIGGNGTTDDIVKRAVDTAGGPKGRVVVFPQASELPETGDEAVKHWISAGIGQAVVGDTKDPATTIAAVRQATFIWFPGGDQVKLMKAFENTGIAEAIRARYAEGALVGGTSAGAAVMSRVMITGDAYDLTSITAGQTQTAAGLGLFPEAIVDQHFLKRQRDNRLISVVLDHPDLVGVGIDETTAILVTGRTFEVLGKNSVIVVDARKAAVDKTPAGQLATGRNLQVSVLKAGMRFSLDLRPALDLRDRLFEVRDQVVHVFDADRVADQPVGDPAFEAVGL